MRCCKRCVRTLDFKKGELPIALLQPLYTTDNSYAEYSKRFHTIDQKLNEAAWIIKTLASNLAESVSIKTKFKNNFQIKPLVLEFL